MAILSEHIPEHGRGCGIIIGAQADLVGALHEFLVQLVIFATGHADAGKIAFHISAEDRHAGIGKALGEVLQSDGFTGAGRARDQSVAVCNLQEQVLRDTWLACAVCVSAADKDGVHDPVPFNPNRVRR